MGKRSMVVSLIGRPNVGKSSLFNRIMKRQNKAITHDVPGVTRDRHYGIAKFDDLARERETDAILVDTGGFYPTKIDERGKNQEEANFNKFFNIMTDHAQMAIDESDLVLFVVDVREGALPFDKTIADYIRSKKKNFWILVNKFDSEDQWGDEADFYSLGLDPEKMFNVSASHGFGMGDLREKLHQEILCFEQSKNLDESGDLQKGVTPREEVVSRIALIGAPNAGKSTLLNEILGSQRALVSDIAGTTVDPIEGFFDIYFGQDSKFLDEKVNDYKQDGILFKEYEDFRKNNPDVYNTMVAAYNLEENAVRGTDFQHLEDEYELNLMMQETEDLENAQAAERLFKDVFVENENSKPADEIALAESASEEVATESTEEKVSEKEDKGGWWRSLHLVDTAGIRRQKSVDGYIEEQSVYRSLRCITESDIVVYMIDATQGISHQDRRLLDVALEKGKSVIVCLNKMDLVQSMFKTDADKKEWLLDLRGKIPWLNFCDVITISAKFGKGTNNLRQAIKKTVLIRNRPISTGALNRSVFDLVEKQTIVAKRSGGKKFKVKYSSMIKCDPPTFLLYSNKSQGIPANYKRYIQNGLRQSFDLSNTPVHLIFRTGADLTKRMKKAKVEMPDYNKQY